MQYYQSRNDMHSRWIIIWTENKCCHAGAGNKKTELRNYGWPLNKKVIPHPIKVTLASFKMSHTSVSFLKLKILKRHTHTRLKSESRTSAAYQVIGPMYGNRIPVDRLQTKAPFKTSTQVQPRIKRVRQLAICACSLAFIAHIFSLHACACY